MLKAAVLLFCVTYACAQSGSSRSDVGGAWDDGKTYRYHLEGRSLSALHQLAHQYTGILLRGKVEVVKKSNNVVSFTVLNAEYADLHQNLTDGWETDIHDKEVNYQSLKLNNERAELYFKNGAVVSFAVNGNLKEWQTNLMKGFISLFQLDLKGENAVKTRRNQIPTGKQTIGFFKTMEDTVSGECLTTYTITPVQKYLIQSNPHWVPQPKVNGENSKIIQIIKAKNFSSCDSLPRYNFGFARENNFEPASSRMGNLLSRAALTRATITANSMEDYTIQSAVSTEQVVIAPNMYNNLHGLFATKLNFTLESVSHGSASSGSQSSISNPKKHSNLVYNYNPASSKSNAKSNQNNDDNSSSSSSSSSNESFNGRKNNKNNNNNNNNKNKNNQNNSNESSSSSSSSSSNSSENNKYNNRNKNNSENRQSNRNYGSNNNEYNNNNNYKYNDENNYGDNRNNKENSNSFGNRRSKRSAVADWNKNNNNDDKWEQNHQNGKEWNMESSENNRQDKNRNYNYENENNYNQNAGGNLRNKKQANLRNQLNQNKFRASSSSSSSENGSSSGSSSSSSSSSEYSSSASSSGISSSEEDWQNQADINEAPYMAFLPDFIAVEGNSVQASAQFNVESVVEKLSYQISSEIHNANSLSEEHTLAKYIVLSRYVETMNSKQMQDVLKKVYVNRNQLDMKNSENTKKLVAWEVYKHAIGSAGTGGALETIKKMIENGQMKGERAAQVISRLPKSAKLPNEQYMDLFFSLVKSPVVLKQETLNSTAVLSFAELLRMAQVSNATAYMRYPQAVFGRIAQKNRNSLHEKYLPYLEQNLKSAISNHDGHKAQVYIKALGKTAHPRILAIHEDYLEGKKQCSQYQRLLMVSSFYHISHIHPHLMRPVLMKLYQNYAEQEEIRVMAANYLMMTNPSAEILQMLAISTNNEPSRAVKSAIISGIESAAVDFPQVDKEFVKNAQAARDHLNPKDYGPSTSMTSFFSLAADDVDLTYENNLFSIRSQDHYIPKVASFSFQRNAGGIYEDEKYVKGLTSSMNELLKKLYYQFVNKNRNNNVNDHSGYPKSASGNSYWNSEKIAKSLGIKITDAPDVETTIMFEMFGGKRVISLGNSSIDSIPQFIKDKYRDIKNSPQFEFTSMYNDEDIRLGFPSIMGLPFIYTYNRPVVVHVDGEANVQTHPDIAGGNPNYINVPQQINVTLDVDATYAVHIDNKFGFTAPFNHHEYFSGVQKDIQVHAGFNSRIGVDTESNELEIKLRPSNRNNKQVVFEYKTVPYTTKYNVLDSKPALEQSQTEIVHVDEQVQANYEFGKRTTGMAFHYKAASERYDDDEHFFDFNIFNFNRLDSLPIPFIRRGIHWSHMRLVYDQSQSSVHSVQFDFAYRHKFFGSNSGSSSGSNSGLSSGSNSGSNSGASWSSQSRPNFQDSVPSSASEDYQQRQQEYKHALEKVSAGTPEADAYLLDVMAAFKDESGQTKNVIKTSATFASSDVSPVTNFMFYYGLNPSYARKSSSQNSYEVCASTRGYFPRIPEMNLHDALKANPNSTFNANVAFGRECKSGHHFEAQAMLSQSEDYRDNFEDSSMVKLCNQHMQKGEAMSDVCQNATQSASQLDNIKVFVNFNWNADKQDSNSGDSYGNARESQLFAPISVWLNKLNLNYQFKNKRTHSKPLSQGKVEFEVQFSDDLEYANWTVLHGEQETQFNRAYFDNELRLRPYYYAHWLMNSIRFSKEDNLNLPSCSLNEKSVNTFDNTTYPVRLGNEWHAVFLYTPKQINPSKYLNNRDSEVYYSSKEDNVHMIAKDSSNGKDVQLVLGDYMVEMKPTSKSSDSSDRSNEGGESRQPAAHVTINGRPASFSSHQSATVFADNGDIAVKVYAKPNGEVYVRSEKYGILVKYDRHYVDIYTAGYFKDNVRGLCGNFDGNQYNDFTSPWNCVMRDPQMFAASYALSENSGSSRNNELHRAAANTPCYKDKIEYFNVISEAEAGRRNPYNKRSAYNSNRYQNGNPNEFSSQNNYDGASSSYDNPSNSHRSTCTKYQVKYIEYPEDNSVCFSIHQIPQCRSPCSENRMVEKEEQFRCFVSGENTNAWKNQIDSGNSPSFRKYSPNKYIRVHIPESCQE